ncbi:MAG: bifunctional 5,10-methylene-tetrahydrofolate dehydrogenase/5,10-methylene-tetrahydrofolate cyclohydrolase [candidate division Zixibacteria bacterium]|nr:bifunctional 5,10-methylene-tetrahydrofolate dehydrogenase/5,10-methylene-tetrahydrofolate cyclohydrolase [candidate division Zixibacteria bacterium]
MTTTTAQLIDGKAIAKEVRSELRARVETLRANGVTPRLAAVLVGDDPASQVYVGTKERTAKKMGIDSEVIRKPATTTDAELRDLIAELNARRDLHGYIIQSPLPTGLDEAAMVELIDPAKDIDGFHPVNMGALTLGYPRMQPCTPAGIVELLVRSNVDTSGAEIVVLGRGNIVGRPISILLSLKGKHGDGTVTVCHSRTRNIEAHCKRADILILAMGRPEMITGDMVKPGATVIDVGVNRVDDPSTEKGYRLVGDAHFDSVAQVAGAITPVPGGVGPMTVAMLMANTVTAAERAE